MATRLLVAHATDLLVRGHATVSLRSSGAGEPTNALYGVARAVTRAIAFKVPERAVAVVDADAVIASMPETLRPQAKRLPALLEAYGFPIVETADAAHVVASYTRAAEDAGCDVVIAGSDKRLAQLVGDNVWWYDGYKDVRYTNEMVRKRFEVGPSHVAQWLALVGDNDHLPGVKGIGKKGATTLIEEHGSVDAALENLEALSGRTGKALRASADDARRELERAVLHTDRPLPTPLSSLIYRGTTGALQPLLGELGFFELLSSEGGGDVAVEIADTEAAVREAIATFDDGPIVVQGLFEDPSPVRGALAGVAMAQGERVVYVPLSGTGRCVDGGASLLGELLGTRPVIGHDVKALVVSLARVGARLENIVGDVACASHLGEPSNRAPHDLADISRQVLTRALPEEESVRGVGRRRKAWGALPIEKAARWAGQLAKTAADAWDALAPETDKTLLGEYLALSDTLTRMEQRGIAVDADDLAKAGADFERIGAELEAEIFAIAGKSFNLGSTKQLGAVLFEDLGLPIVKRTKTGWSTANEALERIEHAHPIVAKVMRWRRLRRLRDSWVTALGAAIGDDGRVHSTFHPARSFSGRLVNSHPDLGRVPGRTPEMSRIRHAFAAPAGTVLLSVDYHQLGLFVLAHLTVDPALTEPLRERADLHTLTTAAVLEIEAAAVTRDQRQLGKVINFATFAGQGASALAMQLGVTAKEAKAYIARFDKRYAVVRAFQDEQLRLASERGYIETIAGRRWPIGDLGSPDPMIRSYAERLARRATHEGSVADVSRRGLLRADQALREAGLTAAPLLQVHDEVLFEVPEGELEQAAAICSDAMRHAFDLEVPLRVGCKAGPNWSELEPL